MADSTSSKNVLQRGRWNSQRQLSGGLRERVLSAMSRHSPTPSLGHSGVGSTQEAAIQFATLTVASSAFAAVGPSTIERPV
jgi:hypothetical protein